MTNLQPTTAPVRPFLDWPVVTDPAGWQADVAILGIQHSEPYAHDPFPNDQSNAPDAIRKMSQSFCYNPAHWDFDTGTDLASHLPARHIDMGNVGWSGKGDYGDYNAAITERVRHLWRQGAQLIVLGGDHGVTIPVVDAFDALGEPVHILHIDAHLDWREEVGGVRRGYSSPLQWASKNKAVSGMTQIGLRANRECEEARGRGGAEVRVEAIQRRADPCGRHGAGAGDDSGRACGLSDNRCRWTGSDGNASGNGADARGNLLSAARAAIKKCGAAEQDRRDGYCGDRPGV